MSHFGRMVIRRLSGLMVSIAWLFVGGIAIVAVSAALVTPLYLAARFTPNLYAALIGLLIIAFLGRGLLRFHRPE